MKLVLHKGLKKKNMRTTIAWSILILGTILGVRYWHTFSSGAIIYVPLTSVVFIYRRDWRLFLLTLIGSIVLENTVRLNGPNQFGAISTRLFFLLVALTVNGRYIKSLVKQGWEGETSRDKGIVQGILTNDQKLKAQSIERLALVFRIIALLWTGMLALKWLIVIKPVFQTADIQFKIAVGLIFGSVVCLILLMRKAESVFPLIWLGITGIVLLFVPMPAPINLKINGMAQLIPSQLNGIILLCVVAAHGGVIGLKQMIKKSHVNETL